MAANDVQEERIRHDLGKSVKEEQEATARYHDRGKYASGTGDKESAKVYDHVAKEEEHHKQEFQERSQELSKQYSTTGNLSATERRYPTESDKTELIDLYHIARTAGRESRYDRMLWAVDQFVKKHTEWSKASAYKAIDEVLQHPEIPPYFTTGKRVRFKTGSQVGSIVSVESWERERKGMIARGEKPPDVEYIPETIKPEPIPDKYKELAPFIDEPLPPGTDFLPAVVVEEGERKIDVVLRQLKDGVEGIQDSSRFRLFLTTMSKFHDYSIGNLILISIQKPAATRVAGFQTWKNLGRWVKKGESGIAILAPMIYAKPKEEEKAEEEEEEILRQPIYFKVVHVFDIGQTEGKALPEFDVPSLTGEANEELFAKALALAKAQGLEVSFESRPYQDPGIKGQYSGKSIWVKGDEPKAQQLKSLLHELAHYYSEGVFHIPRRDAETIAESAAYAVGAHFGFDSGTRSFPYVALWSQDKKVLQANLASIRKVTTVMLEGLEKTQGTEEKMVPALKPFEPYHFAEYVLRFNRFSDAEIPIYSGLTGRNPLRVPDHIWREVVEATEGEFVKQGEINVFHIPEKGRPDYMRAAPTWRDVTSTIKTKPCPKCGKPMKLRYFSKTKEYSWGHEYSMSAIMSDKGICDYSEKAKPEDISSTIPAEPESEIVKMYCQRCGKEVEKPSAFRTPENLRVYMITGVCQRCQDREKAEEYFKKHPGDEQQLVASTRKGPFVKIGERVRLIPNPKGAKYRYGTWPKDVWLGDQGVAGTVTEYHPGLPALRGGGEYFEAIEAWAVVKWDNGADTAIMVEDEGKRWGRIHNEKVKEKSPAVIPTKPSTPSPREELEFISDSPELIPFTIEDIGYRDKLDNAFEMAIARAKAG